MVASTYANFEHLREANRWNVHTYQVLDKIAVVSAALEKKELQLRGFAITGDPQLLSSVPGTDGAGLQALAQLRVLCADRGDQQRRLNRFGIDYKRWRAAAVLPDEIPSQAAARIRLQTRARRRNLLELRQQLLAIEGVERKLLAARSKKQELSQDTTGRFLRWSGIGTLLLTALLTLWLALQARSLNRSNTQLRGSEDKLRTILDNAPVVLYQVDLDEKFVLLAGRSLVAMKLDGAAAMGRRMLDVMGPTFNMEPIRAALRGESSVSVSQINDISCEVHRHPLFGPTGAITGMIGVAIDVTKRQSAESALRESEARFHAFMDNSPIMAFIKDGAGRMIYVNDPMLRRFEKTETEMLGKDDFDLWPPDVARALVTHDASVMAGEEIFVAEERVPTPDGTTPTWLSFKFPLRDASGNKMLGGVAIDISGRKIAEEKLRATSVLQRAILDGAPYSIIAVSPEGVVQSFNRAAGRLLGYHSAEVCGVRSLDFFHEPQELSARTVEIGEEFGRHIVPGLEALLFQPRAGMIEEREWTYVRRDGTRFPVRLSVAALYGEGGQITGYVAIGYDLTESQRAQHIKNEFVSVVSHELRTPLTSIRGALGLLAGGVAGELPPGAKQMIDIAQKNSDRLVILINDILDIEKIESGKMRFDLRPLALRELLESAREQNNDYAQTLGVTLSIEKLELLDAVQVLGDESRLQQILSNLISNACKFTPSGGVVKIRARLEAGFEATKSPATAQKISGADRVQISVEDEGPGVPPEFVPRLFEKFAQADSSSTRKQGGTGLGLAIARAIVEKQGGTLHYIAPLPPATGATFQFDLPLARPETLVEKPETGTATKSEARVLICEDDAETAALLAVLVAQSGFEVEIAATLQEARGKLADAAVSNRPFVGLTLDLQLPDGNGVDLLRELRSAGQDLPVVVVSACADEGKLRGEALRVLDWLVKPPDSARLQAAISEFCGPGVPRLLHVEDDADVRRIVAAILGEAALIVAAPTLRQAKNYLQNERFDLAILDISLPDGSGLDLVAQLNASQPPTPVILFSASETMHDESEGVAASLVKSRTDNDVLRSTIQHFLGQSAE